MGAAYTAAAAGHLHYFLAAHHRLAPGHQSGMRRNEQHLRTAPTRVLFPTEVFRMQSATLKNISMDGNVRFTNAHMNLPSYNDIFQGLAGTSRSIAYQGNATARREVLLGRLWHRLADDRCISLSEEINFSPRIELSHGRGSTAPAIRRSSSRGRPTGAPSACGIRMRATAIVPHEFEGIEFAVPASGVPSTCTSWLIGTLSGCSGRLASVVQQACALVARFSPMPTMPPQHTFMPAARTFRGCRGGPGMRGWR